MPWKSAAISTGASLVGGLFGGGSKAPERAAKDAAARAQFAQDQARRQAQEALLPYQESGRGATRKLSELLGTADPVGYAPRPKLQDFEDQLRDEHFRWAGKDYQRNSNIAGQTVIAKKRYDEALKNWEIGKAKFQEENPESKGSGDLLKQFTYDDFKGDNSSIKSFNDLFKEFSYEDFAKGNPDVKSYNDLLKDFSNEDFVKDPGYTFRMMEGEKGINRNLLARGGFDSGAALKELNRYNQDFASNEFGNAFNRDSANKSRTLNEFSNAYTRDYNNRNTTLAEFGNAYNRDAANKQRTFGFLSGTAGQGLQASGMGVNASQNAANINSQVQTNLGNQLNQIQQTNSDNQSNMVQNTIANLVYGYERNKASNPYKTPDFNNQSYSGGSSGYPRGRDMFVGK